MEQSAQAAKAGLKRKVAVGRFSNETNYGQSVFVQNAPDKVGKQALDILSAKLLETERFILLERSDLEIIQDELRLGGLEPLKNSADYLIVGSVTAFGRKDEGEVGVFSRTKKQTANAKVHVRLVDVRTGRIIYSEEGEGEASSEAGTVLGVGGRAGYDSSLNDRALEAAIGNLASRIIENLLNRPWTSFVLGREEDLWIIAGGSRQGIRVGERFSVVTEGKKINNPQTNMVVELPGRHVATLEVVSCHGDSPENEVSLCRLVDGELAGWMDDADPTTLRVMELGGLQ
jgi:curli biogenesis system outer membrane secretion channel CsgG